MPLMPCNAPWDLREERLGGYVLVFDGEESEDRAVFRGNDVFVKRPKVSIRKEHLSKFLNF